MNQREALERLIEKIEEWKKVRKPRIPTKMPRKVREKILEKKRHRAQKKKSRRKVSPEDDR